MKTTRKWTTALIIIVLIVGIVVATTYLMHRPAPSISLAPSTFVAEQGTAITFTVFGVESNGMAIIYFGDGHQANTTSTVSYTYPNPGRYLVAAQEFVNGQPISSTFSALQAIQITPQVDASVAPLISIPAVVFDVTKNPSAPIFQIDGQVYLYGGFLQPPSGTNVTIARYDWDFGNGATKAVSVNETSLNPLENPITATYAQPGLYPVTLTLVTENSTSMTAYRNSVEQTVAVGSSSQPYALFLYSGVVPNPTAINIADNLGPPGSLDPDLDWGTCWEACSNIFSTLLIYNGSSTTNFIPMAASEVPSISNGGISPDHTSYTFHIRSGLKFSNGDPLTAYDVYYSIVRALLFYGSTGVNGWGQSDWIMAQYLVTRWPGYFDSSLSLVANATDTAGYNRIVNSMAYSNASDTITFKLIKPFASQLFFTALADPDGAGILDSLWLQRIGAGITFTPAGFYAYENQGNPGSYNLEVQNNPVSSGPYMIQSYIPGQSISLAPNPGFPGVPGNPGIPRANGTLVIQWVKYPETSYDLLRSGQADILDGPPPQQIPLIKQEVASGQAKLYEFPTLSGYDIFFAGPFGCCFNETNMQSSFGSQYHMPANYFLNLDVRKAFAYAFNYQYYLDEILGNKRYGVEMGSGYAGVILQGLPNYVPESELQNVPVYHLTYAKQLLQESGEYDTSVHIPFPIHPCYTCGGGNQTVWAMAQMYADAIHSIDPNIVITPTVSNSSAHYSSRPLTFESFMADYPYPSDLVDYYYQDPDSPGYLNSTGHPDQAAMYAQMNALIADADSTTNETLAAQDYKQIEQIAINLYLEIYLFQANFFYVVKPYMNAYQGQVSYLMNPMEPDYFVYWVKTCGSVQACSGRNIGP
jgi:peptide/nickel transport system substrate-binding protein